MIKNSPEEIFRLAAVLYADNNYEVSPKTIYRKVIEAALVTDFNKPKSIHDIIDFINEHFNLTFDEQEVRAIVTSDNDERFLQRFKGDEVVVWLSEKEKHQLKLKYSIKQ